MCYSTKLAVNFAKVLSFLKRGAPIVIYVKMNYQNFHETGLFPSMVCAVYRTYNYHVCFAVSFFA